MIKTVINYLEVATNKLLPSDLSPNEKASIYKIYGESSKDLFSQVDKDILHAVIKMVQMLTPYHEEKYYEIMGQICILSSLRFENLDGDQQTQYHYDEILVNVMLEVAAVVKS